MLNKHYRILMLLLWVFLLQRLHMNAESFWPWSLHPSIAGFISQASNKASEQHTSCQQSFRNFQHRTFVFTCASFTTQMDVTCVYGRWLYGLRPTWGVKAQAIYHSRDKYRDTQDARSHIQKQEKISENIAWQGSQ